ncbi:hypothetical protein IFM51744_05289 [Aspergillus udagawae]|uniref:LysM domain-containing protein n=1 Tax=Aspergillus udagawae TaxID=91492 RepID=A0ABQ1AK46_9EURO|nr:hypothetical protein IFM51744_05289 [Aspergillus udagawae]GFF83387.1 hypothetical protein IFM53868_03788 [Aspergillus udagawae]GFG20662.1 hypothetical protein IFM5058_10722 [Aspergillus udagawae]
MSVSPSYSDSLNQSNELTCIAESSVKEVCIGIKVGNSYTATPKPSPTQDGLIDTCDKSVTKYGTFALVEFLSWNPAIYADCSGLQAKTYKCVSVSSMPTTKPTTAPTATSTGLSLTQTDINPHVRVSI